MNGNRERDRARREEEDVHLPLYELQPRVHVLFRLVLVLLHEHGPDELEHRVFWCEGGEFLDAPVQRVGSPYIHPSVHSTTATSIRPIFVVS